MWWPDCQRSNSFFKFSELAICIWSNQAHSILLSLTPELYENKLCDLKQMYNLALECTIAFKSMIVYSMIRWWCLPLHGCYFSLEGDDGYDEDDEASIADDYLEIFDADQFVRDGNDIRFQLPSNNAALTLSHNIDDVQKKSLSLKRRKTTRAAVVRRKSTRPPPVGELIYMYQDHKLHIISCSFLMWIQQQ